MHKLTISQVKNLLKDDFTIEEFKNKLPILFEESKKIRPIPQYASIFNLSTSAFRHARVKIPEIEQTILAGEYEEYNTQRYNYQKVMQAFLSQQPLIVKTPNQKDKRIQIDAKMASGAKAYWIDFLDIFCRFSLSVRKDKYDDLMIRNALQVKDDESDGVIELRRRIVENLDEKSGVNDRTSEEDRSFRSQHLKQIESKND